LTTSGLCAAATEQIDNADKIANRNMTDPPKKTDERRNDTMAHHSGLTASLQGVELACRAMHNTADGAIPPVAEGRCDLVERLAE
jgi:hypothetical protein